MKNHLILVSLAVVLFAGSFTNARYSGGMGEPNDLYQIATPEDLNDIDCMKKLVTKCAIHLCITT
jgi:hypothetical protein